MAINQYLPGVLDSWDFDAMFNQSGSTPIFRPVTFLTLFWRRFGGAAWWRACASLRMSRESVGTGRVKTITMTCWSRDRVALMTYTGDNARTAPRM